MLQLYLNIKISTFNKIKIQWNGTKNMNKLLKKKVGQLNAELFRTQN